MGYKCYIFYLVFYNLILWKVEINVLSWTHLTNQLAALVVVVVFFLLPYPVRVLARFSFQILWLFWFSVKHVPIFAILSFEIQDFTTFLNFFFGWFFGLFFDAWIGARQNMVSTVAPFLFKIYCAINVGQRIR